MKIVVNEVTGLRELVMPAILRSIGAVVQTTKPTKNHPDGAKFNWCQVEVTYPDNSKDTVGSSVWNKSLTSNPDAFKEGDEISLATQLEGDHAGYSKVGLPTARRVDITKFDLASIETPVAVTAE